MFHTKPSTRVPSVQQSRWEDKVCDRTGFNILTARSMTHERTYSYLFARMQRYDSTEHPSRCALSNMPCNVDQDPWSLHLGHSTWETRVEKGEIALRCPPLEHRIYFCAMISRCQLHQSTTHKLFLLMHDKVACLKYVDGDLGRVLSGCRPLFYQLRPLFRARTRAELTFIKH